MNRITGYELIRKSVNEENSADLATRIPLRPFALPGEF